MKRGVRKLVNLIFTFILMAIGSYFFKILPMAIFGEDILFDASRHIMAASFGLYVVYLFIEGNREWRLPYFSLSVAVLSIVSIQRILVEAHNDVGLLLGLMISVFAIVVPRWKEFGGRIKW